MIYLIKRLENFFSKLKNKRTEEIGRGGDAGEIFIATRKIIGDGKIKADGGRGNAGGKGGKVTLISEDDQFSGEISARGGESLGKISKWYEKWWGILILGIIASGFGSVISMLL